jgi:succinate dehydrogenase / fumarate reductase cytochrome b subunit
LAHAVISDTGVKISVSDKRPVNLDISTISLPITAIVSILHRVSGVVLFGVVALMLWGLDKSLSSAEGFAAVQDALSSPLVKFIVWASLAALAYHFVAGVRHLIMDMGVGETLEGGLLGAKVAAAVAVVVIVLMGLWVW